MNGSIHDGSHAQDCATCAAVRARNACHGPMTVTAFLAVIALRRPKLAARLAKLYASTKRADDVFRTPTGRLRSIEAARDERARDARATPNGTGTDPGWYGR